MTYNKTLLFLFFSIFSVFGDENEQVTSPFFSSAINTATAPLNQIDDFQWSMIVANTVNIYFSAPYDPQQQNKYSRLYALKCRDGTIVNRPNHSLAHGLRQAYLAVDLIVFLKEADSSQLNQEGKDLYNWIIKKQQTDPTFLKKVEFTNAFQRTGRQSELSGEQDKAKYTQYLIADQQNFQDQVVSHIGTLFKNQREANIYKRAIIKRFDLTKSQMHEDTYFLANLFHAAHLLDLRRLPNFSKESIFANISFQLFGTQTPNPSELQIIEKAWARSGSYLRATGDRNMENPRKMSWNQKIFCAQAHNPTLLVRALQRARTGENRHKMPNLYKRSSSH